MAYDFSGYATKHNIRCSDGRTIMPDAFKDCDGQTVPLVWQHMHDSPENILGHADLENRPDGVYAYCSLNNTADGKRAKEIVKHGDICALSIYANRLQQVGQNVMHGVIREVSLVLAGANPGATIDNLAFAHSDGTKEIIEDEACIQFVDQPLKIIFHADDEEDEPEDGEKKSDKTIGEIIDTMNDEQKEAFYAVVGSLIEDQEEGGKGKKVDEDGGDENEDESIKHADDEGSEDENDEGGEDEDGETIQDILDTLDDNQQKAVEAILDTVGKDDAKLSDDVKKAFDSLSEKQKDAVYALAGYALEESEKGGSEDEKIEHADGDDEDGETIQDVLDTLDDDQKKALDEILKALSEEGEKAVSEEAKKSFESFSEKQKDAVYALVGLAMEGDEKDGSETEKIEHADIDDIEAILDGMDDDQIEAVEAILDVIEQGKDTVPQHVADIVDGMTDDQKEAVQMLMEAALDEDDEDDEEESDEESDDEEEIQHSGFEGETMTKRNLFESNSDDAKVLSHDDMKAIFDDAPRVGTLKEAVLQHGIADIEVMFPEAQAVSNQPYSIARRMEWVSVVLNGVKKSPFARIKSTAANLTEDQARAKGYIKGFKKIEEQIQALKRVTTPQTIYKKQALDRDDVVDITDFDVVAWLKQEMRMMLDEEAARAILVGDGRRTSDPDKISPEHIRPVWGDDSMYTIYKTLPAASSVDYSNFIDEIIRARSKYKGSGNPVMFVSPSVLTEMRLLKDQDGRPRYDSDQKLAETLRVSAIHEVELFDDAVRTVEGKDVKCGAIILNLADYTVGADKGGEVSLFDDFDIDFNRYQYLIETRMSGALTMPYSAIAIEFATTTTSEADPTYKKVATPNTSDIADYFERDEYGRYISTPDTVVMTGKTYYEAE